MTTSNVQAAIQIAIEKTEVEVNKWLQDRCWSWMAADGVTLTERLDALEEWTSQATSFMRFQQEAVYESRQYGPGDEPFIVQNERHSMTRLPQAELIIHEGLLEMVVCHAGTIQERSKSAEMWIFVDDQLLAVVTDSWEDGNSCANEKEVVIDRWVEEEKARVLIPGWYRLGDNDFAHESGATFWMKED